MEETAQDFQKCFFYKQVLESLSGQISYAGHLDAKITRTSSVYCVMYPDVLHHLGVTYFPFVKAVSFSMESPDKTVDQGQVFKHILGVDL